jgi:lysozyme
VTGRVLAPDVDVAYGHLVHLGGDLRCSIGGSLRRGITEAAATDLLRQDAAVAEHAVVHLVTLPLSQGQYDALVSFTFNEGAGRLQSSTLLKLLNGGDYAGVPDQLMAWVIGGRKKLPGLVARRTAEAKLWAAG